MEIEYIKTNGRFYYPIAKGVKNEGAIMDSICLDVCFIKKLLFGRFQIDYYDARTACEKEGGCSMFHNQIPNVRLIVYPSGIQEIKYTLKR